MIGQAGVVARADESAAGFDSAVLFVGLHEEGQSGDSEGRVQAGGDECAVYLLPFALDLTIPDDANLKTAVRSLEFLVSASTLPDGRELRAEIIGLELNAD